MAKPFKTPGNISFRKDKNRVIITFERIMFSVSEFVRTGKTESKKPEAMNFMARTAMRDVPFFYFAPNINVRCSYYFGPSSQRKR
jgi:hypothetical protein